MKPAIQVQNVSKYYRIGARESGKTFREAMTDTFAAPFRRLRSFGQSSHREEDAIWALKDVSFEVMPGEVVGIIGRNGAGKSTLLKILSRITDPTEGRAIMNGRVASLLEVGTGFHPELTGRENIYLSGAILGMSRAEINRKFDEIVDFSGIEKFIDTPVKRYSSGMAVRLGFAVAAHLEPEILIVDEVLAVGDAEFQKKCLGKMQDVATGEGRTVLFVSHSMGAIQNLCPRAVLLNSGVISREGKSSEVVSYYLQGDEKDNNSGKVEFRKQDKPDIVHLHSVCLENSKGYVTTTFGMDEPVKIILNIDAKRDIANFHIAIFLYSNDGSLVFKSTTWDIIPIGNQHILPAGPHDIVCQIPSNLLNTGNYHLSVDGQIPDVRYIFQKENLLQLKISDVGGIGGIKSRNRPGIIRPKLEWTLPTSKTEGHTNENISA